MDLKQHLLRQMAFSHATFGPGTRREGVLDHMMKEIEEVRQSNGNPEEWIDLVILALDGLTREISFAGLADGARMDPEYTVSLVCDLLLKKQTRNEGRTWPDWRTADPDKAIEHNR